MQGTRVSPRNTPRNGIALKYLLAKAYMLTSRFKNSLLTSSSPYLLLPNFEILANLMISHSLLLAHKDDNFFPMCLLVVKIIFHGNFHFNPFSASLLTCVFLLYLYEFFIYCGWYSFDLYVGWKHIFTICGAYFHLCCFVYRHLKFLFKSNLSLASFTLCTF